MNREPQSPPPEQPATLAAEAERSFFARRASQETVVVSGETRVFSPTQRVLEATITFGILILVALSTANSIYIANWVEDMPDLRVTATAGVLLALILGRARRIRVIGAMLIGFVVGGLIVMAQITQLETLGGQPLFWDRFTDFGFRFQDWFNQAFSSGLTTDNLPFVFFTDVFVFVASFLGAYAVARWRNPWVAMILLGAVARRQRLLSLRPPVEPVLRLLPDRRDAAADARLVAAPHGSLAQPGLRLSRLDLALVSRRDHAGRRAPANAVPRDSPPRRIAGAGRRLGGDRRAVRRAQRRLPPPVQRHRLAARRPGPLVRRLPCDARRHRSRRRDHHARSRNRTGIAARRRLRRVHRPRLAAISVNLQDGPRAGTDQRVRADRQRPRSPTKLQS